MTGADEAHAPRPRPWWRRDLAISARDALLICGVVALAAVVMLKGWA